MAGTDEKRARRRAHGRARDRAAWAAPLIATALGLVLITVCVGVSEMEASLDITSDAALARVHTRAALARATLYGLAFVSLCLPWQRRFRLGRGLTAAGAFLLAAALVLT